MNAPSPPPTKPNLIFGIAAFIAMFSVGSGFSNLNPDYDVTGYIVAEI
ncbi:hypothetical protein EMIT0P218_30490 [Pseudomonas sp. IT-P218]